MKEKTVACEEQLPHKPDHVIGLLANMNAALEQHRTQIRHIPADLCGPDFRVWEENMSTDTKVIGSYVKDP